MKRLIVLVVLILLVVAGVLAVRWLPWWASVLGLVLLIIVGKLVAGRLIRKLFLAPFRAKGAVLKGASATVHSVSVAEAPAPKSRADPSGEEDSDGDESGAGEVAPEESAKPRRHYVLDVTISPQPASGPFGHWEPGELRLVRPESQLRPESDAADDDDDACEVSSIQISEDGTWKDDEGMKFPGPQRLKLHLAVLPDVRQLKFRYYFEEFGQVSLP